MAFGVATHVQADARGGGGWLLALVVCVAVAARAWLHFSTSLVPGINGAYYLIQARSIMEKGTLALPDLPLIFYLDAVLARVFATISGWPLETAIFATVKTLDSFLPPLAALPVYRLVRRWSARGPLPALLAAFAVAAGAPALFMVGDFQKNALGLVWLAALLWALREWLARPTPRRAFLTLLFLALAGVTHVGAFGTTLLLGVLVLGVHLLRERGSALTHTLPYLLGAAVVVAAAGALVAWKFDPARVQRLIAAVTQPAHFFSGGKMPGPGFGGPGGNAVLRWLPSAFLAGIAASALAFAHRRRHLLEAADRALITGCALGVIVLTGPWVQGDKVPRFYLNAAIPTVLIATFTILQIRRRALRIALGSLGMLLVLGGDVPLLKHRGPQMVNESALRELAELKPLVFHPEHTLIVAMHGQEWWAAWVLHTHIAHFDALVAADWERYDVLFLEGSIVPPFGPPGSRPGADRRPPPPGGRLPPGGLGPPGLSRPVIPADAECLYLGKYWTLARVAQAIPIPPRPPLR